MSDGVDAGTEPGGSSSGFGTGALVATGLIALVVGVGGGYAIGHSKGTDSGKKVGIADGEQEGAVTGANAALGGLSGWENGALYVVTTGAGNGVATAITARHLMEPGNNYKLCKSDPQKLCESPQQ